MFEEDNRGFPLLWDSLINDASDSHLLDFPRFLCVALAQCDVQASCKAPKSFLPFPLLQHGLVFTSPWIQTRSHRNRCRMLSSRTSLLQHATLAISVCDPTWLSLSDTFNPVKVKDAGVVAVAVAALTGISLHSEDSPITLRNRLSLTSKLLIFPSYIFGK